jgi:hypothetical protein
MEMEMEILSINIQTLTKIKFNVLLREYNHVPIILLQELNLTEGKQELIKEVERSPWKLYCNQYVGILIHKSETNHIIKTNKPYNGRSITLVMNKYNVTSVYAPTNALAKPDYMARVLYTSLKGCSRGKTILGGDFNAHLNSNDAVREHETGEIETNIAFPNGVFRNFLILTGLQVASSKKFTHAQKTINGYTYSRKDYILKSEGIITQNYEVIPTTLSDHGILRYTCYIDGSLPLPQMVVPHGEPDEQIEPRLKDKMRKFAENKNEFLNLYSRGVWTEEHELLVHSYLHTQSLRTDRLQTGKQKLCWANSTEAYQNVSIFLSSPSLQRYFALGKCFYRVQQIQDNMVFPSDFDQQSLQQQVQWIHHVLKTSLKQISNQQTKKRNYKGYKQHSLSTDEEYKKWVYYSKMVRLISKAIHFQDNTEQKKRLFGIIRKECPSVTLHRTIQAKRLRDYFKDQRDKKGRWLQSNTFKRKEHTENLLQSNSLKRVINDVMEKNIDLEEFEDRENGEQEQVDHREREQQVANNIKNWVTPMSPREPDIQISEENEESDEKAPIDQLNEWAWANNLIQSKSLKDCLGKKNVNCDWSNVSKPITTEEIDKTSKNRTTSPGFSRVTYRMVLYSTPRIKEKIANILTNILTHGEIPENLKVGLIKPIPKEVGVPIHHKCRPIILLETLWKILTIIIARRIQSELRNNQALLPSAHGFLSYKKLSTPIITKELVENHARRKGRRLLSLELDISKAYDYTRKHVVVGAMDRLHFPSNLLKLVKSMTTNTNNKTLWGNRVIGTSVLSTLRQGDPFSCLLFVAQLDILLCAIDQTSDGYEFENNRITCLAYADDITSIHSTPEDAQRTINLCSEFFRMNNQQINPKKSYIRHININPQKITIYGEQLPILQNTDSSRYLGVWLQPNGGIEDNRKIVQELFVRFRNFIKTKLSSVRLRAAIVNSVFFPKVNHIVGHTLWRQNDLDKFEERMQQLICKDADPNIVFGSSQEGAMGIWSPRIQGMTTLIKATLSQVNRNLEIKTARELYEESRQNNGGQTSLRGRHLSISRWVYDFMCDLLLDEAQLLNTCANPLAIPVTSFVTNKKAPMDYVRTLREYLTSMKLTIEDTHQSQISPELQDLYDVLPAKKAYQKAVTNNSWAKKNLVKFNMWPGFRLPQSVIKNGWCFTENGYNLSKFEQGIVRPKRLAANLNLWYGSVVGYELINGNAEVIPQLGVINGVGSEMVQIIPVRWLETVKSQESHETYEKYGSHVMTQTVSIRRDVAVEYSLATSQRKRYGWEVFIEASLWVRDRNVILMEILRRKYRNATLSSPLSQLHLNESNGLVLGPDVTPVLDGYTDGSLTRSKDTIHMGAAAVIRGPGNSMLGEYAVSIPPLNLQLTRKAPATTKPETIGAALAAWMSYSQFRKPCNLYIDNMAVVKALKDKKFNMLIGFDSHAGGILEELNKRGVIRNVSWIKSHQNCKTIQSEANYQADEIAEAARRGAQIQGHYVTLPMLPTEEIKLLPMHSGGSFELPYYRSKHFDTTLPVVPDANVAIQGYTTDQVLQLQQAWTYKPYAKSVPTAADSPKEPSITAMSLRIKSGLGTLTMQQLVDRPDLFGVAPLCPACGRENVFTSEMDGWKHILFECSNTKIQRAAQSFIISANRHIIEDAIQIGQNKWDKTILTEVDSTQDYLDQQRVCKKCVIPRMIRNMKAGQLRPKKDGEAYRLDLYYCFKSKPKIFSLWKDLLNRYNIAINIQLLECVLNILAERDWNVYIGHLEPIFVGPSIWIKPKNKEDIVENYGLRAIHWFPIFSFSAPLCWWNEDVACGQVCKHTDYLPTGAVVYVKRLAPIPLHRLQHLWELCYLEQRNQRNQSETQRMGVWINGSQVQQYIQDVPGLHHSQVYENPWVVTHSEIPFHTIHWWLRRNKEDVIRWYQGRLHKSPIMQENLTNFSRLSQKIERHFRRTFKMWCHQQDISSQVLWDRKYLREYRKNPNKVIPYVQLNRNQKAAYQRILARNRQAMASSQRADPIYSNLPQDEQAEGSA